MSWTIRGQAGYPTIDIVFMFVGRTIQGMQCARPWTPRFASIDIAYAE